MHAISSYCGNRPTNKHTKTHTNRQDRLQYTAPLSLAHSVIRKYKLMKQMSPDMKLIILTNMNMKLFS